MAWNETELSYRRSAIEGASLVGLTVALYDTLAGDLNRASRAVRQSNIEARCREANHALLVLGHLESWLDFTENADLVRSLGIFYAYIRQRIMCAQAQSAASIFEELGTLVVQTRASWQQLDLRNADLRKGRSAPPVTEYEETHPVEEIRAALSCSV